MAATRRIPLATLCVALLAALTACSGVREGATVPTAPAPVELRVSAATSLKRAFEKLAPAFEKTDRAKVVFDFGASGLLQTQIEAGAPCDVFVSASPRQIDALVAKGLIPADSTETVAGNSLVLFVPKGDPAGIRGPQDLWKAKRLTTGDPAVAPHGAKAKEWLTKLGSWGKLQSRFVFAQNAAQTLDYVARGEVDAGIGFGSETVGRPDVEIVYTVPAGAVTPIRYVAGRVGGSDRRQLATAFLQYLRSAEAQRVMREAHFLPPGER